MILFTYLGRLICLYAGLIGGVFFAIALLDSFAGLVGEEVTRGGAPFGWPLKLAFSAAWALPDTLDFSVIILMLATVISLTMLGRRAELHILRGAGRSSMAILALCAGAAVLMSLLIALLIRPLSFEAAQWADARYDPERFAAEQQQSQSRVAWFTADAGQTQGRISGFNPESQKGQALHISRFVDGALIDAFRYGRDIELANGVLSATVFFADRPPEPLRLPLDGPVQIVPFANPAFDLPLPHLLGWVDEPERFTLSARHTRYLTQSALAEPVLTAALVFIAGSLCVGIGTRQPLGRLIFATLALVVLAYSLFIITRAFGINGRLTPSLAAWGGPALLCFSALGLIAWQDLTWLLGRQRSR